MSNQTVENLAAAAAGIVTAICMTLLYIAMSAMAVETVRKFLA
jgi:hypothetical protein